MSKQRSPFRNSDEGVDGQRKEGLKRLFELLRMYRKFRIKDLRKGVEVPSPRKIGT